MSGRPRYSLIVRAWNEAHTLPGCLAQIARQEIDGAGLELILVDGGSADETREIAARAGARVETITPQEFTYGRSLNRGCAAARGELLVPVSAHAFLPDPGWLRRIAAPFADPRVACVSGDLYGPDGRRLESAIEQDAALARARPEWGYSNSAGALRADLWRQRPFLEELIACEDKEWALHWLEQGFVCVIDPGAVVEHDHTHDPVGSIYDRARREWEGLASFQELAPYGVGDLLRDWWGDLRFYDSPLRARLSPRRAARLLGMYAGRRRRA